MTTEERVAKLEKELARAKRRTRVMLVAAVMTAAGMFLLGAGGEGVQQVVRAERFELVDANGTVRAALGSDSAGRPGLWQYDQNGTTRALLCLGDSGQPGLRLYDQNGTTRASLRLGDSGQPGLGLLDQNESIRVALVLNEFGQPMLELWDLNGKVRAWLGAAGSTTPDYPESSLLLFGPDGEQIWSAP